MKWREIKQQVEADWQRNGGGKNYQPIYNKECVWW